VRLDKRCVNGISFGMPHHGGAASAAAIHNSTLLARLRRHYPLPLYHSPGKTFYCRLWFRAAVALPLGVAALPQRGSAAAAFNLV